MKQRYDRIGSLIWILLGVLLCLGSTRVGLGKVDSPESGFIPFLTGGSMVVMAFIFLLSKGFEPEKEGGKEAQVSILRLRSKGVYSLITLFLYAFLLEPLGFLLSTFLLFLALFKIMDPRRWTGPVFISVPAVIISYLLFCVWLKINFPKGVWGIG